jgi:O-antigen biosynthesis protein
VNFLRRYLGIFILNDWSSSPESSGRVFLLSPTPGPGWYILSVRWTSDQKRCYSLFNGSMGLQLISGVWRRRIVRIRNNQIKTRLVLSGTNGLFSLTGLRLIPLLPIRRRRLIRRKLNRFHYNYGDRLSYQRLSIKIQWRDYNRVLSRSRYPLIDYDSWIEYVELPWLMKQNIEGLNSNLDSSIIPAINIKLWFWSEDQESFLKDLSINSWNSQKPGLYGIVDEFPVHSIAPNSSWICPIKPGDQLAPHALRSFGKAIKCQLKARLIYSDEDHIDFNGRRHSPQFKPAWNQELFYSDQCYSHCWLISEDLYNQSILRLVESGETITLYSLMLEATSLCNSDEIIHLPEVLYHCVDFDVISRGNLISANIVERHLIRLGHNVKVEYKKEGGHLLKWIMPRPQPLVSIIIPTKDHSHILETCLTSLQKYSHGNPPTELIIIDNGSTELDALAQLEQLRARKNVTVLSMPGQFNYSALNNYAATFANGKVLAFLNNDVEVLCPGWLSPLVANAIRPSIGAVGPKLLFDDGTVQHGGVILGIGGVAGHAHKYFDADEPGYQNRLQLSQNVSAVTGAVMVLERELFTKIGGFDEQFLAVNYNDIDLCLRLLSEGYRNLYCPISVLIHHESKSRGAPSRPVDYECWQRERNIMINRWGEFLYNDPAYSPHLSLIEENFSLSLRARHGLEVVMPPSRCG